MKLIIGLGNPGKEYEKNRHNIGFMVIDNIAKKLNINMTKEKFGGIYGSYIYKDNKFILLKPQKYINLSGEVIKKYIDFYKIDIKNILIISDDLDMQLGNIKLKQSGGSGGHNGLKNIELYLGTNIYQRLKIGISNNKNIFTKDYVLSDFEEKELVIINSTIENATTIALDFINISFLELMNKHNIRGKIS